MKEKRTRSIKLTKLQDVYDGRCVLFIHGDSLEHQGEELAHEVRRAHAQEPSEHNTISHLYCSYSMHEYMIASTINYIQVVNTDITVVSLSTLTF
ncbi:hypothetical protein GQ600_27279 [Phytophthora cactorum]|nr:hypothetical protein GQ600_27279 [Phytophthora cactorum]